MVGLLDVDPDFEQLLPVEEREVAGKLRLPVYRVLAGDEGADVGELLAQTRAFGAIVLDGMLVQRLRVADQVGLRLLGAGDLVIRTPDANLIVLAESEVLGTPESRLALLDETVLFAVRRWPAIAVRLLERYADQSQTLAAQLVIGQMPRVDRRLMALMWLLADRWGRVTKSGTHLPLNLTHGTLGALIGARRSTVTLALGELVERGSLAKRQNGWLVIEPPPQPTRAPGDRPDLPTIRTDHPSPWQPAAGNDQPSEGQPRSPRSRREPEREHRRWVRDNAVEQRRKAALLIDSSRRLRALQNARNQRSRLPRRRFTA